MSLLDRLIARIAREGPITVADYMATCLRDPAGGYYATRPRLGETGDFITAPLISQMFGEMLGLWAADVWCALGTPPLVRLLELGPGDGTMMRDVLRAARAAPGFVEAADVWLLEINASLRDRQAATLVGHDVRWIESLADLANDAPTIILGNEFLDCLPVSQMAFFEGRWIERRVAAVDNQLIFRPPVGLAGEGEGPLIHEHSVALCDFARQITRLLVKTTGAALFIDYGRDAPGYGDTLQALRGHVKQSPLDRPGEADLTAHVDFSAFIAAARAAGASTTAIVPQGRFLRGLGIETRADDLARARPDRSEVIARQLARLIAPDQMGILFKVVGLHSPSLNLPGF